MSPKSSSLFFHNCCISHAVVIFKKCTQYICSQSGNRRQYFQPIRKQEAISAANQETGGYICSQSGNRGDICSQSGNRRRYLQPIRIQEAIFEANYRKQEVLRLVGHADQEFKILIAYGEILGGLINCGSYCTCCLYLWLDGSYLLLDGSYLWLDGSYLLLDGSYLLLDGSDLLLDGSYLLLHGSYLLLDGSFLLLDGLYLLLDGSYLLLDGMHHWPCPDCKFQQCRPPENNM